MCEQSFRQARANSVKYRQAHLYTGIPDMYISWGSLVLPWVCRVRGCKSYNHDFGTFAKLQDHFEGGVHGHEVITIWEP